MQGVLKPLVAVETELRSGSFSLLHYQMTNSVFKKTACPFIGQAAVCRKRSPKGGFFVIIDKGEENVSKRNHGKKHELHPKSLTFGVQFTTKMV